MVSRLNFLPRALPKKVLVYYNKVIYAPSEGTVSVSCPARCPALFPAVPGPGLLYRRKEVCAVANSSGICYVVGAMSLTPALRPYPAPGDYVIAADRGRCV